jgi:hypothetical protein
LLRLAPLVLASCQLFVAPPPPAPPPPVEVVPVVPEKHGPELPLGGRELFPTYRLVGFCGTPGGPALGPLDGNLPAKAKKLAALSEQYADGKKPLLVFELIVVVVMGAPMPDGKWRRRVPDSVVDEFLALARQWKGLLLLNIQPGQSDFMTELKHFEKYLHEPDVGVTLDPEWSMKPGQKPGVFYGQTTGAVVNEVGEYLSGIVKANDLPEKALVFHQVNKVVFREDSVLVSHPGVALIKSVDGLGPMGAKIETYRILTEKLSPIIHPGFKLFFDEDTRNGSILMTPKQVLALSPLPDYVMYE